MNGDARAGGTWSASQRRKNALLYWVIRAALALADRLPEGWLPSACRGLGALGWWLFPRARRIAMRNVACTFPGTDCARIARRSFVIAGENLGLALQLRRPRTRVLERVVIDVEARRLLEDALRRGAALFVSAHFGPFELIAPRVAALGLPASVIVRQSYDARLDAVVDRHRVAHGVHVIHRGGARGAAALRGALRRRTLMGLLADLPGRGTRRDGSLFGAADRLACGAVVLARELDLPLLVGVLEPRRRGTYALSVERIASDCAAPDAIGMAIQRAVRASPEQWLWMGDPLGLATLGG